MEARDELTAAQRLAYLEAESRLFDALELDVTSRMVSLAEPALRVRVLEAGDRDGQPLLLVHGGGGSATVWAPLMSELTRYRLLAVDRPGSGMSDAFDYGGVDLRRHAVAFMGSLLDELGLPSTAIVANSMGGLWSFWLALHQPDRVAAIAQLGCPALMLDSSAPLSMRMLATRKPEVRQPDPPADPQRFLESIAGARAVARMSQEMIDAMFRAEQLWANGTTRLSLLRSALQMTGARAEVRLGEDDLAAVRQSVLYVWGEADTYGSPEVGEQAIQVMPDASLEILPAGHMPWLDEPKLCAEAITLFLADRAGT
jgi:pimeloyl-ACP methyl ester carboxylesterase